MHGQLRFGCVALCFALAGAARAGESIAPGEIARRLERDPAAFVLDVRSEAEYAAGHVPGARLMPHDELPTRIAELGPPREVIVYCRSGRRVELVRPALEAAGFDVRAMDGSFLAWQEANLPVQKPSDNERKQP